MPQSRDQLMLLFSLVSYIYLSGTIYKKVIPSKERINPNFRIFNNDTSII